MLPLVSSRNPRCSGGAVVRIAGGEELDRLRLARFVDFEVVGRQAGDRAALLVGDDDAEVHEIDRGAERLLSGGDGATAASAQCRREPRATWATSRHCHGAISQNTL